MRTAKTLLALLPLALVVASISGFAAAQQVTVEKEYYYQAGESDSKVSSRNAALAVVKRMVLEGIGTYVSGSTVVKDYQFSSEQINSLVAGTVGVSPEKETWDGSVYYVKAKATVDPDKVAAELERTVRVREAAATAKDEELAAIRRLSDEVDGLKTRVASMNAGAPRKPAARPPDPQQAPVSWTPPDYAPQYQNPVRQPAAPQYPQAAANPINTPYAYYVTYPGQHAPAISNYYYQNSPYYRAYLNAGVGYRRPAVKPAARGRYAAWYSNLARYRRRER